LTECGSGRSKQTVKKGQIVFVLVDRAAVTPESVLLLLVGVISLIVSCVWFVFLFAAFYCFIFEELKRIWLQI